MDLCSECEKTLAQTEEGQMTSALETSKTLLALCGLEGLAIRGEGERGGGAARAAELAQLQIRMMEVCVCVAERKTLRCVYTYFHP